ncbi:MAG: imm11 family protein [Thermoguttaceae bacterium]
MAPINFTNNFLMIVYKIHPAQVKGRNKYAPLYPKDTDLSVKLDRWPHLGPNPFFGPFTRENWTKSFGNVWPKGGLEVEYDGNKKRADSSYLYLGPVFSSKAIEILSDYLDTKTGEFLPLRCKERNDLLLYRCMNCIDALDRKNSTQRGEIKNWDKLDEFGILDNVQIDRIALKEKMLEGITMFVLPCHLSTSTFVTDKFVDFFRNKKLKGLGFRPVWSSLRGPLCDIGGNRFYDDFEDVNI